MRDSSSSADPILIELVRRAGIASRLRSRSEGRLLQTILDAAVALFRANAASVALVTADGQSLEFVLAAGTKGAGVVGRTIGIDEGLAGYVFQTGEPMALGSPEADPRFGRTIAEQTGYVPSSILVVPLLAPDRTIGVIEILDCRDGLFSAGDLELASIFARQAATAIDATRVEREFPILLANALASYELELEPEIRQAVETLPSQVGDDFWRLVDEIAGLSQASPATRAFILDLLVVANRHLESPRERSLGG